MSCFAVAYELVSLTICQGNLGINLNGNIPHQAHYLDFGFFLLSLNAGLLLDSTGRDFHERKMNWLGLY